MSRPVPFRARPDAPCPICGREKSCAATDDGMHMCREAAADPSEWRQLDDGRMDSQGFYHYRRAGEPNPGAKAGRAGKAARKTTATASDAEHKPDFPVRDAADHIARAAALFPSCAPLLAASLGVPEAAFDRFPELGYWDHESGPQGGPIFSYPERSGRGALVGVHLRYPPHPPAGSDRPKGEKKMLTTSYRAITLPADWLRGDGPVFVFEGLSDVIAAVHALVCAIGRPGKDTGERVLKWLAELLRAVPADRPVVIVAENDTGTPADVVGARQAAAGLTKLLGREVLFTTVPDGAKDVRVWLTHPDRGETPWADRGAELAARLMTVAAPAGDSPTTAPDPHAPPPPAGDDNPDPTRWDKKPEDPHRLADTYLSTVTPSGSPSRLRYWLGDFHEWSGGCYHTVPVATFRARLTDWISREFERVHRLEVTAWQAKSADSGRGERPKVRPVPTHLVSAVVGAIAGRCHLPDVVDAVNPPVWLDGFDGPEPRDLVPLPNALVHVPTGRVLSPTPSFFSFAVAPFEYDPNAPPPVAWVKALKQYFKGDAQSAECLQEMMGLFLTGQTQYQRQLMIIGGSRSGKGTTLRVIQALVGKQSCASTTLTSLAGDFGLEGLVGKTLAVIPDMLVSNKADNTVAVERMLNIIGEDDVTINPKGKKQFTQRMPLRFLTACNEPPELENASGALANRTIVLEMDNPFAGHEDPTVEAGVMLELPGILLWAMEGFRRLRARTRFVQPDVSAARLAQFRRIGSKHEVFVNERCVIEDGAHVPKQELFEAWQKWCKETNYKGVGDAEDFGRKLRATVRRLRPGVEFDANYRPRFNGDRVRCYKGIRLRSLFETDDDNDSDNGSGGKNGTYGNNGHTLRILDILTANNDQQEDLSQDGPGVSRQDDDVNPYTVSSVPSGPGGPGYVPSSIHAREEEGVLSHNSSHARMEPVEIHGPPGPLGTRLKTQAIPPDSSWTTPGPSWDKVGDWLYVSKKLDVTTLPANSLDVVTLDGSVYYKLTLPVYVWLENAVAALDTRRPPPSPVEVAEVVAAMDTIHQFARLHWSEPERDAARAVGPQPLPEPETGGVL